MRFDMAWGGIARVTVVSVLALTLAGAAPHAENAGQNVHVPVRGAADNQLSPLSQKQFAMAETHLAKGELARATDYFESALAADPRNGRAFVGLARVAEAQGLPGKAVRFYRQALQIDPNNLDALELQGNALLVRGARPRAEANLERLKILCGGPCPQATRLATTLVDHSRNSVPETATAPAGSKP